MSERTRLALLLAPALTVIGVLFLGGLAAGLMRSFGYMPAIGLSEPGLGAYRDVLSSGVFLSGLVLSLHIAVTSTLLSAAIGIWAALLLRRAGRWSGAARLVFNLNLTVPHVVGAVGMLYLLSQSGSLARLAFAAGMIEAPAEFPALVFDPFAAGIILQYVWKEVPFVGLVVLAQLQSIGEDYEAAARTLGATRWQTFRHVTLPLILPGALAASAIVLAFSFGAYEVPALLGASHPQALPVLAYRSFTDVDLAARPQAMAMAMVIALISLAMVWAYMRAARALGGR
jgi:putative spermidine/putrescine transport system permease protein